MKKTLLFTILFLIVSFLSFGQFVENKGQVLDFDENFHPEVKYYHSSSNAGVYFQNDRVVYNFIQVDKLDKERYADNQEEYKEALKELEATYYRMDLVFQNANSDVEITSGEAIQGVTHFYLNKRNGIRDVKTYSSIQYNNVYPNIDVVFHTSKGGMKYDIVLREGANIDDVQLKFEGFDVRIEDKRLIIPTEFGDITEEIPLSFLDDNEQNTVDVEYVINKDGSVGFKLKKKVKYSKLTIDPVLEWSTYFNYIGTGSNIDYICNHLDDDGNYFTYGMGYSAASTYPVINPGSAYTANHSGSSDAYIAKFNSDRQLVWSTYLGGSGADNVYDGRVITTFGNTLHVIGESISSGAPFTNGGGFYQANANRNFWARFNKNTGTLQHLTSLSSGYKPNIAISNSGLVVISNDVYDFNNLPIMNRPGAYNQNTNGGFKDMGLLMFNASYNQVWGTFWGGAGSQERFSCVFDNNDNLYFVGETSNNSGLVNLPGAYNQIITGGGTDVVLGKFNTSGQLVWATLIGGDGSDARAGQQGHAARAIIHPTTNELLLAFNTTSTNLPLVNLPGAYNKGVPTHPDFASSGGGYLSYAAYLCKFSPSGAMNWATYYYTGTGGGDIIENIALGGCDKLYIGSAGVSTKPLTGASDGYNLLLGTSTSRSGYITMLNSNTYAFEWDSYLNTDVSYEANVAANINQARFYTTTRLYYDNLPVVDPSGGAYFNSNNVDPTGAGIGISQFHPSLPPNLTDEEICEGGSVTLTASGGMGAPYNWYSSSTGGSIIHTGSSYTTSPSSTTTYYVTSGTGTCASPRAPITVTVVPGADAGTINGPSSLCVGNTITLTSTGSGIGAWSSGNTGVATVNSSGVVTGVSAGTATISYTVLGANGCPDATAIIEVTVTPSLVPTVTITGAPTNAICSGASVTFTANPINGGTNPTYQWRINGVDVAGETGVTFTTTGLNDGDVVTIIMDSDDPCADPTTVSDNTISIDVTNSVIPTVTITGAPTNAICSGASVTFTANPINGGTNPTYQWRINGVDIAGETGVTFTTTGLNDGDVVTIIMDSDDPCADPTTVSDNTISIDVTNSVIPTVTITGAPTNAICSGASVTFTANPINGGTNPTYQWRINGVDVAGETGVTFTTTGLNDGDVVTIIMDSDDPCADPTTVSDNTISIDVTNSVIPTVTITGAPTNAICSGASVTFTANPINGGTNPTYQWRINGVDVAGETGVTFTTTGLNDGDVVTIIMDSDDPCADPTTVSDNTISIDVTNSVIPTVTITGAPTNAICSGASVTFTANPINGGTNPTYQWRINGVDVAGETGVTFTTTGLNDGDVVTIIMDSDDPCADPTTVSDNTISIDVTNSVIPTVTITGAPTNAICSGASVTFTANPINGGTNPTYQWRINGVDVAGETGVTFTTTGLNDGDVVTIIMDSDDPCADPTTVSDNTISIDVTNSVIPTVTITGAPTNAICSGASVTFTANPINGGTNPTYQWRINGVDVAGETGVTFTTTGLNDGDVVTIIMDSDDPCANPTTVSDNTVSVGIVTNVTPSVSITGVPTEEVCAGESITFTANPTFGGANPTYQWQVNGVDVTGETGTTFTTSDLVNGDIVSVILTSDDPCADPTVVTGTIGAEGISIGDSEAPVFSECPADITVSSGNSCDASVTWTAPTVTDNCTTTPTLTSTHNSGDNFPVGTTVVTYTAEDDEGNIGTCSFNIIVVDDEAPAIVSCISDAVLFSDASCETIVPDFTVDAQLEITDNCSSVADGTLTITQNPAAGTELGMGTHTVEITVEDAGGNTATCSFELVVSDTTAPVIDIDYSPAAIHCAGNEVTWTENITDNCGVETVTSTHQSGDTFPVGTTTVTYTATDASGNESTYSFDVVVGPSPNAPELSGNNFTVCYGKDITLSIDNYDNTNSYSWIHSGTVVGTGSTHEVESSQVEDAGIYTVTATSSEGCVSVTEVELSVNQCEIVISGGISPNGDGLNDVFEIGGIEAYPKTEVWIYNRWGAEVYHSEDYKNDWDGTSQSSLNVGGNELPEGTYYYVIRLGGYEGQLNAGETYKGYVYLKR